MQVFKRPARPLLLLMVLLCNLQAVFAIDEQYAALPLRGNQLRKDSVSLVKDTVYFNPALKLTQTSYQVRNLVTFKIDEFSNLKLPDTFSVSVKFKVYYTRDAGGTATPDSTALITLTIGYNKNARYDARAIYTFRGGHQAQVKIFDVIVNKGTLAAFENVLMLENEIMIDREYTFSCTNNAVKAVSHNTAPVSTQGELLVTWGKERAADEYDLEWAFIDSSAAANYYKSATTTFDPKKVFENNGTRVSITQQNYLIPLLYDNRGFLVYRVRAVQVKPNGQRIESAWSSEYSLGLGVYDFSGHATDLNWQATTAFAEEGKRKSIIQYFDGSLRGRQTVTKDNTTDTTIVAEIFYDYQGRPAIQVLPAPSMSRMINYTPNFNSVNGAEYTKDLYDGLLADSSYCAQGAPLMDSSSGTSKYYSANNPLVNTGYHQYIPKANGYPFAETRYTPDNTDRVSLQSGVGPDFRIGGDHASRYYYSHADQEELDALFGSEAGHASHYFKNMVRDANGQYSVSYIDMHGRTVATALAGFPLPYSKLDTLASNNFKTVTRKLLDSSTNIIKGSVIESSKGMIVTKAGMHRFRYNLLPDSIKIQDCNAATVCYDCVYDLEITITDECNNSTLPGGVPYVISNTGMQIDTTCMVNGIFPNPGIDNSVYLREGSYLITKKLVIRKKAMDDYREVFLRRNTCKKIDQFIREQQQILSLMACAPDSGSCRALIGDWESFRNNYMQEMGIPVPDTAAYRSAAILTFNSRIKECEALRGNNGLDKNIREQMLADVSPSAGQYADTSVGKIDAYSIFAKPVSLERYKEAGSYLDENGRPDPLNPQRMERDQFVGGFKSSWAETLLKLHPEYNKLVRYEQLAGSHTWDEKFSRTETFQEAVNRGYLNPANFSGLPANVMYTYKPAYTDSLFTYYATAYKAEMQDSLFNKIKVASGSNISAWSIATIMAHCKTGDASCLLTWTPLNTAFTLDPSCSGDLDYAWRYFREIYLQEKREIVDKILTQYHYSLPGAVNLEVLKRDPAHYLNFQEMNGQSIPGLGDNEGSARDSLNNFINENCVAYATQWWEQLKPCNFNQADSQAIVNRLIQVCKEGGDAEHIFGSSTVKPSSTNLDRSFEQVIKAYAGANYNSTCNIFLITAPRPYDQQPVYYNKPVLQKPDSCECATINSLHAQYLARGQQDGSFAAWLNRTTGTTMSNGALDTLRMACNGQINCMFLKTPYTLPPVLQCGVKNICVDCLGVDTLYTRFKQAFPGVTPSYDNNDSLQRSYNQLFERYMNQYLGFSKSSGEYLTFIDSCTSTGYTTDLLKDTLLQIKNSYTPAAGAIDTCKTRFAQHFNQLRGTNYSFVQLDSLYGAHGLFLDMCNNNCVFQKTYGSTGVDLVVDVKQTFDGGYVMAGNTVGFGNGLKDGYILKTDARGNLLWSKTYGGAQHDFFDRIKQTADSGFIAIGRTHSYHQTSGEFWIVKTNKNGDVSWSQGFASGSANGEYGYDIIQLTDGGYALIGLHNYSPNVVNWQIMRLTSSGSVVWAKRMGTNSSDNFGSLVQDHDTLVIAGLSYLSSFYDGVLMKLNIANGSLISARSYDINGPRSTWFSELWKTPAGFRISMNASNDFSLNGSRNIVMDVDQAGNVQRARRMPAVENNDVASHATVTTADGGYITTQGRNIAGADVYWLKSNAAGNITWANKVRMPGTQHLYRLAQSADGSFVGVGASDNDIVMMKISSAGLSGCNDSTFSTNADTVTATVSNMVPPINDTLIFSNTAITVTAQNAATVVTNVCGNCSVDHVSCDSLTKIYNNAICEYNSQSDALVNTRQCNVPNWIVQGRVIASNRSWQTNELKDPSIINNGVVRMLYPDSSIIYGSVNYYSQRAFRVQNEYTIEARVKNPNGTDVNISMDNHSVNTPGYIDEDFLIAFIPNWPSGYYHIRGVRTYDNAFGVAEFSDFRTIKYVVKPDRWEVYYEGALIKTLMRDGHGYVDRINGTHIVTNISHSYEVDWVKIYGANDSLMLYETFDNYPLTARPDPKFLVPREDCKAFFRRYFRGKTGKDYQYEQIKAYYKERCGIDIDFCDEKNLVLCGKTEPVFAPVVPKQHSPCNDTTLFAVSKGTLLYEAYRDSLMNSFDDRYMAKCLQARYNENFTVEHAVSEYHYTLYYFDQAGNLVKTIPPQGVDVSKFSWMSGWSDSVRTARRNKQLLVPKHQLPTRYWYNSLGQPVAQQSPDGGKTRFWYDRLGRPVISQNAKQKYAGNPNDQDVEYSYTKFDFLGRIAEVGQVKNTSGNGAMTQAISQNPVTFQSWLQALSGRREQITQTLYDLPYAGLTGPGRLIVQQRNLRNRISMVSVTDGSNPAQYNQAVIYTYDIHGNVDTLLQDYGLSTEVPNIMNRNGNRWKKIAYQYDLVSGKVNMVMYQLGWGDQFYHRYKYDADNRLTLAETSVDSLIWQKDARYEYYRHGPLARTVLGEQAVQGIDYTYTLQGWLKGVNSTGGTETHDMGGDGRIGSLNQNTARDALGYNLNYFGNEYSPIKNTVTPFPNYSAQLNAAFRPLYNGNVSSMAAYMLAFDHPNFGEGPSLFYNYKYDQLNRLTSMDTYTGFNRTTNTYPSLAIQNAFKEKLAYDANGNITRLLRTGRGWDSMMDSLTYSYYPGTNRLRRINDNVDANKWGSNSWEILLDIDNQDSTNNYVYDSIGNLVKDHAEKISNIKWSVYGKILEISRGATRWSGASTIRFTYDALGNRISKTFEADGTKKITWYVRDAQGNLLSTYNAEGSSADLSALFLSQADRTLYGSNRVGIYTYGIGVDGGPWDAQAYYSTGVITRGWRQYELANHLGNVLTTVSDRKFGVSSGGVVNDYYLPDILSATEYYPFGMMMRGRTGGADSYYRFGFNGKEHDWEVKGWMNQQDYGMRIYDPRVGRFLSTDPLEQKYPWYTPYQFAGNKPIWAIDLDGAEEYYKSGIPFGYMHNSAPIGTSYTSGGFGWTILDQKSAPDEGDYRVTKLRILDARKNHYFVKKMERVVTTATSWGPVTNKEVIWAYNPEAPRLKSDAKPYNGPAQYKSFETEEQIAQRQNAAVADGIGTFWFGVAAFSAAIPAATATGGTAVWAINNPFTKLGAVKAFIGGGGDWLGQYALNPDQPINWISVGANALFANPWTSAAVASATTRDAENGYSVASAESFFWNTVFDGGLGAVTGKYAGPYAPKKFTSTQDNAARTGVAFIFSFLGNYGAAGAANAVIGPDQNSSNEQKKDN